MLKRFSHFICLSLLIFGFNYVHAQQDFSKLVAFGDSLSDTGNIANATINFPYPYYENRISDGPVAIDYLAAEIGSTANASQHLNGPLDGYNYAVAGGNILGDDIEDLSSQISAYLDRVNDLADPNALFVVLMGGNDLRGVRSIIDGSVANSEIDLILNKLIEQLTRLSNAGVRKLLVSNVANIGRLPETLQRETDDPGVSARATMFTQTYNNQLAKKLEDFADQTGLSVLSYDLYAELENIVANASALGFTQTPVGCFDFDSFDFHPDCLLGQRFDRFVFFDNLHPTSAVHQIIAASMIKLLNKVDSKTLLPLAAILLLLNE